MLNDANELSSTTSATTDKATPINLTQHSYFNLAGHGAATILGHELTIDADRYTPVDATLIPTGELAPVAGTPFDFRQPTRIGARIDDRISRSSRQGLRPQLGAQPQGRRPAARRARRRTQAGRTLEVQTTEPGVQFYTGNFLDGTIKGKGGTVYDRRNGLCLETQHFPDSPNQPKFPSTILKPGQTYQSKTVWKFGSR